MRSYAKVDPRIWMGVSGSTLRSLGRDAHFFAHYLMTCPHCNSIGLFQLTLAYASYDMGMTEQEVVAAISKLSKVGFCKYDHATSTIWLVTFAESQFGLSLKPNDNNVKSIESELSHQDGPFINEFLEKYRAQFNLSYQAPSKPLRSPFEAPPETLRSMEMEREMEIEKESEKGVQGENTAPAPPPAHTVSEKKPKAEDKNAARVYDHYLHNVQTTHASNREQTIRNISSLITRLQKEDIGDGKTREDLATYLCQTIDRYLRSAAYQTDPQFHYKASNFFGRRGEWSAFAQDDSPAMMPREDEDARRRREIREEIAKRRDACFADYEARGIDCRTITLVDVPKGANCDGCRRQIMALDEQAKRAETREQTVLETEAAV